MSVAIFCETRRDVQVALGSEKLATIVAFGARIRPASATTRHYAARHGFHKWLDAGSGALDFVSARAGATDYDKTPGPPATRGSSLFASLPVPSAVDGQFQAEIRSPTSYFCRAKASR